MSDETIDGFLTYRFPDFEGYDRLRLVWSWTNSAGKQRQRIRYLKRQEDGRWPSSIRAVSFPSGASLIISGVRQ